jgi:hypothetical protein
MTRSFCTGPDGGLLLLIGALLLSGVAASSPAAAQSARPAVPDADARWRTLRSEILDPGFFFQSVGAGTGAHLGDEPEAWGETPGGYAARVGSNAGAALLQIGTTHALAAALRLDIRPRLRQHDGVGTRLRHAALSPFVARTPTGARVPNLPNAAGAYAGALAQTRWERGRWTPGRALQSTAISLGVDIGVNVVRALANPSPDGE